MALKPLSIKFPPEQLEGLQILAKRDNRSLGYWVRWAVSSLLLTHRAEIQQFKEETAKAKPAEAAKKKRKARA